ncbi:restriction endonuclease subunit S [Bacteroidia bacterium]|nr:restriction endonuclease subunit S [Bacteroidia bacterium]
MELTATKYKQTEVGLIPEDWEVITLSDAVKKFQLGGNYPNSEVENQYPLMKMGNIDRGTFKFKKIEYIASDLPDEKDRLKFGDVLFNTRNTLDLVGKVAIWKDELNKAYFNSNLMRFEFDQNQIASNFFFNYLINTKQNVDQLRAIAIGTTSVAAIYTRDLINIKLIKPSLTEQKAIAKVLSDTDALIQALEKKIAKKKLIKKGVMQKLLTPKEGWDYIRLGDITTMNSGGTPTTTVSKYYGGNIVWVSISDISDSGKYISNSLKKISDEGLTNSSARLFKSGTVLLAMYASIGKCCIATNDVTTSQAILGITTSKELLNEYLYYYLIYKVNDLISQGQQGTQSNLNKGIVEDYQIHLPKTDTQKQIAQTLSDMDKELEFLEQKLSKYQLAKQGMMQQLLTGKIRIL